MQVVIFNLNDEQYAVETNKVESITDTMEITKVPKAPPYIKGLINLRGNIISLLDINLLLNIDKVESNQSNIIILEMDEEFVGITVEQVDEVLDIDEEIIERSTEDKSRPYIKGVINFMGRIITLIDIDKMLLN